MPNGIRLLLVLKDLDGCDESLLLAVIGISDNSHGDLTVHHTHDDVGTKTTNTSHKNGAMEGNTHISVTGDVGRTRPESSEKYDNVLRRHFQLLKSLLARELGLSGQFAFNPLKN